MPIVDQGYQHWQGQLSGHAWRWLTVAREGVRVQPRGVLLRLLTWASIVPALALAAVLILWGLFEQKSAAIAPLLGLFNTLPPAIRDDPVGNRLAVWTIAYQYFLNVQLIFAMLLIVLLGPNLVSQDLRFNALPLYFSRPVRRWDYFLGKLGVIAIYLWKILLLPALLAYVLGICFSMDLSVVRDTARLMLGVILYSVLIVLSAGTLVLAFSALSRNSRYVQIMWFGFWVVSWILGGMLTGILPNERWTPLVSYTSNLHRIEADLLDTRAVWGKVFEARFAEDMRYLSRPPRVPPGQKLTPQMLEAQRAANERMLADMREKSLNAVAGPDYPWWWSGAVLAGLFGLSLCILTTRVKSLDRLK